MFVLAVKVVLSAELTRFTFVTPLLSGPTVVAGLHGSDMPEPNGVWVNGLAVLLAYGWWRVESLIIGVRRADCVAVPVGDALIRAILRDLGPWCMAAAAILYSLRWRIRINFGVDTSEPWA
jgi:hypothetical protein